MLDMLVTKLLYCNFWTVEEGLIYLMVPIRFVKFAGDKVWVADTRGKIGCLDLKAGAMHRKLQGSAGSIRALQLHPTRPIIASSGLDRFLYLHNTTTGKLLAR